MSEGLELEEQDRGHIIWGGIGIKAGRKNDPTCIGGGFHRWDGPTTTGVDGWTLAHGTKCSRCGAIWMEVVRAD